MGELGFGLRPFGNSFFDVVYSYVEGSTSDTVD